MSPVDFRRYLGLRPFQPFRIRCTDGATYDVFHPDQAAVFRSVIELAVYPRREDALADRALVITLIHILRLEPLDAPPAVTEPRV